MITKEDFKELVLAGASNAKQALSLERMKDVVNEEEDIEFPDEVYEIMNDTYFTETLSHLAMCVAGIIDSKDVEPIIVSYKYADLVSLFAFENENAEHYLDLIYKFYYEAYEEVIAELQQLDQSLPQDELFYVRRHMI